MIAFPDPPAGAPPDAGPMAGGPPPGGLPPAGGPDGIGASAGGGRVARIAERMPAGWGSIRVRMSLLYSAVVFGLASVLVATVYIGMAQTLAKEPVTETQFRVVPGQPNCGRMQDGRLLCVQGLEQQEVEVVNQLKVVEKETNRRALDRFRAYAFGGLGGLFLVSLGVGWAIAGSALAPIGRITSVARDIGATDLSRRIRLPGPDDELKRLADTFDDMLSRVETAFEQQRTFIHEASHELRNPIAVIRTNVEVALSDPDAPAEELRETLVVVGRAAERMGVLVDDLLQYARREARAERETVVDVAAVIEETAAEFAAPAEARRLAVEAVAERGLLVHGDPVALKQALANLLANAVRLAPEGTTVRVAGGRAADPARPDDPDRPWVWLTVSDEGPGIPAAEQHLVFDRFYRGHPDRARAEGRSGLGLTIVRQIARSHGGSVGLRSELGVGSIFSIWLPALRD